MTEQELFIKELKEGISKSHEVLDSFNVPRGTEEMRGGVCLVTEFPVHKRIEMLAEQLKQGAQNAE